MKSSISFTLIQLLPSGKKERRSNWEYVAYFGHVRTLVSSGRPVWSPAADLSETDQEVIVEMNLAGIQSSVIRIDMSARTVKIAGVRNESSERQSRVYHLLEIERGEFERQFHLPAPVVPSTADVSYSDGLLTVRIKKMRDALRHACSVASSNEGFE